MSKIKDYILSEEQFSWAEQEVGCPEKKKDVLANPWEKLEKTRGRKWTAWLLDKQGYTVDFSPEDWGEPPMKYN
jgi:hypothetical protein